MGVVDRITIGIKLYQEGDCFCVGIIGGGATGVGFEGFLSVFAFLFLVSSPQIHDSLTIVHHVPACVCVFVCMHVCTHVCVYV